MRNPFGLLPVQQHQIVLFFGNHAVTSNLFSGGAGVIQLYRPRNFAAVYAVPVA
jgi:hypothetical protein